MNECAKFGSNSSKYSLARAHLVKYFNLVYDMVAKSDIPNNHVNLRNIIVNIQDVYGLDRNKWPPCAKFLYGAFDHNGLNSDTHKLNDPAARALPYYRHSDLPFGEMFLWLTDLVSSDDWNKHTLRIASEMYDDILKLLSDRLLSLKEPQMEDSRNSKFKYSWKKHKAQQHQQFWQLYHDSSQTVCGDYLAFVQTLYRDPHRLLVQRSDLLSHWLKYMNDGPREAITPDDEIYCQTMNQAKRQQAQNKQDANWHTFRALMDACIDGNSSVNNRHFDKPSFAQFPKPPPSHSMNDEILQQQQLLDMYSNRISNTNNNNINYDHPMNGNNDLNDNDDDDEDHPMNNDNDLNHNDDPMNNERPVSGLYFSLAQMDANPTMDPSLQACIDSMHDSWTRINGCKRVQTGGIKTAEERQEMINSLVCSPSHVSTNQLSEMVSQDGLFLHLLHKAVPVFVGSPTQSFTIKQFEDIVENFNIGRVFVGLYQVMQILTLVCNNNNAWTQAIKTKNVSAVEKWVLQLDDKDAQWKSDCPQVEIMPTVMEHDSDYGMVAAATEWPLLENMSNLQAIQTNFFGHINSIKTWDASRRQKFLLQYLQASVGANRITIWIGVKVE